MYPTNVIPETRRTHEILYLRFYYAYNEIGYDEQSVNLKRLFILNNSLEYISCLVIFKSGESGK